MWTEIYNGFSFPGLYNFIVDYLEDATGNEARNQVDSLLTWWNRYVIYL